MSNESTIKRKYVFKYKPEFLESFTATIKDDQIIPLILHVFEKLQWPIVYADTKVIEAKYKGDFGHLSEKVTITKATSGKISVHSASIDNRFMDLGKNSMRTGIFIAEFKKLEVKYQANGKLIELATEYQKQNNWEDYKIPTQLPKPKKTSAPNVPLSIIGGLVIALAIGVFIGFLTVTFTYIIGVYEFGIGIAIGYLFAQVLKTTNYTKYSPTQYMLAGVILTMFITNQYTQYLLLTSEIPISDFGFIDFMKLRIERGLTLESLNTGWIGLLISWILQLVISFIIAQFRLAIILMKHAIEKIPEKVLEYTIYLFEMDKPESEVRAELAQKGWNKTSDQNAIFEAIGSISGFQQHRRE